MQPAFLEDEAFELFIACGDSITEQKVELAAFAPQTAAQLLLLGADVIETAEVVGEVVLLLIELERNFGNEAFGLGDAATVFDWCLTEVADTVGNVGG